jgi:hypothetical protein
MSHAARECSTSSVLAAYSIVFAGMLTAASAGAQQTDIPGPPGSVAFGSNVRVLPGGNFVVADPNAGP